MITKNVNRYYYLRRKIKEFEPYNNILNLKEEEIIKIEKEYINILKRRYLKRYENKRDNL